MGLIVQHDGDNTELKERISADLINRAKKTSDEGNGVDLVKDSKMLEGTSSFNKEALFWFTLTVLAILSLIVIFALK